MNKTITTTKNLAIKQDVRFGKPTILNTRITVADILNLLEAGYSINEIPEQYKSITVDNAKEALRYASNILGKEEILTISS